MDQFGTVRTRDRSQLKLWPVFYSVHLYSDLTRLEFELESQHKATAVTPRALLRRLCVLLLEVSRGEEEGELWRVAHGAFCEAAGRGKKKNTRNEVTPNL